MLSPVQARDTAAALVDKARKAGADAADARGKGSFDHGAGGWCRSKRRCCVGESPGRRGVPQILNGRIVVGGDAVDDVESAYIRRAGKAEIGIVPGPCVQELVCWSAGQAGYGAWRVIGDLNEGADVAGDRATPEPAERR